MREHDLPRVVSQLTVNAGRNTKVPPASGFYDAGAGGRGGTSLESGGGAQGQREGDRPAGGGRPEIAGQPDQTPRDHRLPDRAAGAAAQQQDCHTQGARARRTPLQTLLLCDVLKLLQLPYRPTT